MSVSDQITRTADEVRQTLEDFGPVRWVEALKSGKYTHHQTVLGVYDHGIKACCLGVLVDAAGVAVDDGGDLILTDVSGDMDEAEIPSSMRPAWLDAEAFEDDRMTHMERLIDINDDEQTKGYARQITYIEEHIIPEWTASHPGTSLDGAL